MHPTTEQLLDLRDGNADGTVTGHVSACPACRAELDRLVAVREAMRALPAAVPPPRVFERITAARSAVAGASQRWRHGLALAAAASLVMVVALTLTVPPDEPATAVPRHDEIALLAVRSGQLERLLEQLEPRTGVFDLETADTIVALEDRIAAVDSRLRQADALAGADAERLWQQRVELMHALVGVHAARTQPTLLNDTI